MPLHFILVRHGESEGNLANRNSRMGDDTRFENKQFQSRHSSHWRLDGLGVQQAKWAGGVIRDLGFSIGRKYSSPYLRALETIGHMRLGGLPAMVVYELRERSWGLLDRLTHEERLERFKDDLLRRDEDPFLWQPTGGEALVGRKNDICDWLGTVWRECGDMECVVVVCHAETMEIVRVAIERMLPEQYAEMSKDKTQSIWNCGILHYTRQNPFRRSLDTEPCPYLNWVRLVTPPDAHVQGATGFGWKEIIRPTFTDDELLEYVERVARRIEY